MIISGVGFKMNYFMKILELRMLGLGFSKNGEDKFSFAVHSILVLSSYDFVKW